MFNEFLKSKASIFITYSEIVWSGISDITKIGKVYTDDKDFIHYFRNTKDDFDYIISYALKNSTGGIIICNISDLDSNPLIQEALTNKQIKRIIAIRPSLDYKNLYLAIWSLAIARLGDATSNNNRMIINRDSNVQPFKKVELLSLAVLFEKISTYNKEHTSKAILFAAALYYLLDYLDDYYRLMNEFHKINAIHSLPKASILWSLRNYLLFKQEFANWRLSSLSDMRSFRDFLYGLYGNGVPCVISTKHMAVDSEVFLVVS